MTNFSMENVEIEGLKIITPFCVEDDRGFYIKTYEKDIFRQLGMDLEIHELCGSCSKKGVVRGLHFQTQHAQSKLVRCAYGRIFDVSVDLRPNSKTFGKWYGIELTHLNKKMIFIPSGFAHGIMALSEDAILSYHSAERYIKEYDTGILWNDKDIGIDWPLEQINFKPILSEKDKMLPTLREFCRVVYE